MSRPYIPGTLTILDRLIIMLGMGLIGAYMFGVFILHMVFEEQ